MENINLKWVIAHEPAWLFYRVAKDFQRLVNEKSKEVQINIEILTADEYNQTYNPEVKLHRNNLWKALQNNTVQIAQMTTSSLGRQFNKSMQVFDLPYIFEDHKHAADILEGPVGKTILNQFTKESNLKGLAYTYSGGFRLMPVDHSVSTLKELVGKPMRSGMSMIAQDTIKALGMNPVPTEVEELTPTIKDGKAVGGEHVAQRLLPDNCDSWTKTIIDTEHSLFLTSIVVNQEWWNSLSLSVQQVFVESAFEAARNERELSIKDGKESISKLEDLGVKYIRLSNEEKEELKAKTKPVYEKYDNDYFESGLVSKIKK
jgi:TRAP-type C4-dicarboxylate transport system substrate-binding protein